MKGKPLQYGWGQRIQLVIEESSDRAILIKKRSFLLSSFIYYDPTNPTANQLIRRFLLDTSCLCDLGRMDSTFDPALLKNIRGKVPKDELRFIGNSHCYEINQVRCDQVAINLANGALVKKVEQGPHQGQRLEIIEEMQTTAITPFIADPSMP